MWSWTDAIVLVNMESVNFEVYMGLNVECQNPYFTPPVEGYVLEPFPPRRQMRMERSV